MQTYYDKVAIFQQFLNLNEYRKKIKLSPYLNAFFDYSQQTIKSQYDKGWKKPNAKLKIFKDNLEDRLIQGYQAQTHLQKLDMYIRQMKFIKNVLEQNSIEQEIGVKDKIFDDAYTLSYTLHIWKRKTLKLNYQKGLLQIIKDKITKEFYLQNYIIRQSRNNQYNCFVLQSLNTKVTDKNRTMRVGFKTILPFQQWFLAVKAVVIKMERVSLRQELAKCSLIKQISHKPIKPEIIEQIKINTKQKQQSPEQTEIIIDVKQKEDQQKSEDGDIIIKAVMQVALDESKIQKIQRTSLLKTHANIFAVILPDYDLSTLQQQSDYSIVHQQNQAMILRNSTKSQRYKVIIPTHQKNINRILSVLFNVSEYSNWNPGVELSTIKSAISSENMVIIYQKNKQYNTIYRARDFVFLRHVFVKDQGLYVVDKSIDNSDYPSSMFTVRGNIEAVWGIIKNEENTFTVIKDITIQNQGLINDNQDHNISMQYLKGLLNFKSKIQNSQQDSNNYEVFDLNWRIYGNGQVTSIPTVTKIQQSPQKQAQHKRRKTMSQSLEKVEIMTRRVTVPQKPQSLTQKKPQIVGISLQNPSQIQQQLPLIPVITTTTTINYQFDNKGEVIIPQTYLNHKYSLSPTEPKQKILQQVINGHAIWKGQWKFDPNGGIIFINQTKIDHQKGVLKYVLSKIAKNLLSGKSILQISLPVDIFAPETNLERFAFSMAYAPLLLEKGLQTKTALEKFKWVIAYGITNSVLYLNMQKPFNPILGETFQGWINGCPIYLQQISHHPPIASFLFLGRGYKITGSVQSKVQMQMNSGCGITDGVFRIQTDDGADFNFITPGGQISGLTFGQRRFNLVGKYYVWSKKYQLFVQIKLDPSAKGFFSKRQHPSDYMEGTIYEVKRQFLQDFQLKKKKDSPSKQKTINDLGKVSGIWSKILTINDQTYLNLDKDIGCKLQYDQYLLPSDGNWRQDVVYKKLSNNIRSQTQKQRLENVQRNDRKLRGNKY